tara:strand:- start:44804 stop:45394 length:591 start_codon:yes stop_codon:yes gene_type:complete
MPKRVFKLYQRKRIINVNVNILAAGLISIALTKYPIHWISLWIGEDKRFLISVIAYVLDTIMDVCVYYGLHWIANHWNPHGHHPEIDQRSKYKNFAREATRVQAERAALVPVFMLVAMGGMWALQKYAEIRASWSFVFAFIAAMLVTRVIHTVWGYRTGTFQDNTIPKSDTEPPVVSAVEHAVEEIAEHRSKKDSQ